MQKPLDIWSALPPYQTFPNHILTHLSNEWMDTSVRTRCDKPFALWPKKFRIWFQKINPRDLLKAEAISCGVVMAPSRIKHERAGMGLFAGRTFKKKDVIGSYYGTLIYTDMAKRGRSYLRIGEGNLSVDVKKFKEYALQVQATGSSFKAVRELSDGKLAIFIVPAPFCVCSLVNDCSYLPGDRDLPSVEKKIANEEGNVKLRRREPNVAFIPSVPVVRKRSELTKFNLVKVVATRLINPGEELYVNYGKQSEL